MAERSLRIEFADIRVSVILFDEAYFMKPVKLSRHSPARLKAVHKHSNYEIFFVNRGRLTVVTAQGGVDCEDSLVVIPPLLEHYTAGPEFEGYAMNFVLERLPNRAKSLYDCVLEQLNGGILLMPLTEDEKFYVEHIAKVFMGNSPKDHLQHLLYLLYSELFHRMKPHVPEAEATLSKQAKYINTIETYITKHYCEEIHLSDVAKQVYLCTKQITRIVRKEYGCSFSELVTGHRLAAACMLLKHTNLSVREIASNVGYHDRENYFFTLFKKKYGLTPMQYREQIKHS